MYIYIYYIYTLHIRMYYMFKSGVVVCTCNSPTLEVKFQSSVGWR